MKRKILNKKLATVVVAVLAFAMGMTSVVCSYTSSAAAVNEVSKVTSSDFILSESNKGLDLDTVVDPDNIIETERVLGDDDEIGFIIAMDEGALIDNYIAKVDCGYKGTYAEYLASAEGQRLSSQMKSKQSSMFRKIAKTVDATMGYSYVSVMNGFSIKIKYGDVKKVDDIVGRYGTSSVKTMISEHYAVPEEIEVTENVVDVYDTGIINASKLNEEGYDGSGMLVAILDTGLDYDHWAFSVDNFTSKNVKWTKEKIAEQLANEDFAAERLSNRLTASDVYVNAKVPYAYDYADKDTEVNTHYQNEHGTHVAGIIAGKSLKEQVVDEDGNYKLDKDGKPITEITGVAPNAQLAIMKVFSDYESGGKSEDIIAAVEDCSHLGVDAINMSLGSSAGFTEGDNLELFTDMIYGRLENLGISLVVAASNSYSSGYTSYYGLNLTSNPDSATVGSPSTYSAAISVAAIMGVKSNYLLATGDKEANNIYSVCYFNEAAHVNGSSYDFIDDITKAVEGMSEYHNSQGDVVVPYVTIPGIGSAANYAGINVKGKIAFVKRGSSTFEDKITIAKQKGALACVIYNNVAGVIRMQVGDSINMPACSISMDEASTMKSEGYIVVNSNKKAGPFMCEFSSWGCTPNLKIKPEITAQGGEIYSATPGNNYARLSGTSMACPNLCGAVAVLRASLKDHADKYGLDTSSEIALNRDIEARVYQLMMSTATIVNDKFGNPYSVRKQGAGMVNLDATAHSEQLIYVLDEGAKDETIKSARNKTKIELGDDPDKTGVYNLEFYVQNFSNTAVNYDASAVVYTEAVSSDGKTVAEKAYMLTENKQEVYVADQLVSSGVVTVAANSSVKVKIVVTLSAGEKAYLDKNFANGMFVEGYAVLKSKSETYDLNCCFMGFYGDWGAAPLWDYDMFEISEDEVNDTINDDDKRHSNGGYGLTPVGKITENGHDYSFQLGRFVFYVPDGYDTPATQEERCALSFNPESLYQIYGVGGFLRNAKQLQYKITNAYTGELIYQDVYNNARKSGLTVGLGGCWIELGLDKLNCINNGKYTFTLTGYLDWRTDDEEFVQKQLDENEWSFSFYVDTEAPRVVDANLNVKLNNRNEYERTLDFFVYDNHYSSAMSFDIYNKKTGKYESIYDKGLRPINGARNSTTKISFDLTNCWDDIRENNYLVRVAVYDSAFNHTIYTMDLSRIYVAGETFDFGEFATYNTYTYNNESISILSNYNEDGVYYYDTDEEADKDGNVYSVTDMGKKYISIKDKTINLIVGQSVDLSKSLITNFGVWPEDLVWSSSKQLTRVSVNSETGEILAIGSGTATITVKSKKSGKAATINVRVLEDSKVNNFGIKNIKLAPQKVQSLEFEDKSYAYLDAGESYEVEVKINPWYLDTENYYIVWTTGNRFIATVEVDPENSLKATITANKGSYETDESGRMIYTPNISGAAPITATVYDKTTDKATIYSARFTAMVLQEFVISGSELTEYHGIGGEVYIPQYIKSYNMDGNEMVTKSGVETIKDRIFLYNKNITKLVFNEGVTKIGYASCAYMEALTEVVLPSTLEYIDSFAFQGALAEDNSFMSKLRIFDTTACTRPIFVGHASLSNHPYFGVDADKIANNELEFVDTKLDTSHFVSISTMAFVYDIYLHDIDLSGTRSIASQAFMTAGANAAAYGASYGKPLGLNPKFGEHTDFMPLAFYNSGVVSIELPMNRITGGAFLQCSSLKEVFFTGEEIYVEAQAFTGCRALETVMFKGNVNYIGQMAFGYSSSNLGCAALNTLVFEKECRYIAPYAFMCASSLTRLTLPAGLEYVGDGAFAGCSALTQVTISKDCKLERFNGAVFYASNALKKFNVESGNKYMAATSDGLLVSKNGDELIMVPSAFDAAELDLANVKAIRDYAFSSNTTLKTVNLPDIELLGEGAFMYCINLESVVIGNKIKEIPDYAFAYCTALTEVTVGDSLTKVGAFSFAEDSNLEKVVKASAGDDATGILLPDTVTAIGVGAFVNNFAITNIVIPDGVTVIERLAFGGCTHAENIAFHKGVTSIGEQSFYGTNISSLSGAAVSGIETIGEKAFANCQKLRTVSLSSVKRIERQAFARLANVFDAVLNSVTIRNAEYIGEGAFYNQTALTTVSLPNVKYIGGYSYALAGVTNLTAGKVEYIDDFAFGFSNVDSFVVPATCKYVSPTAFAVTSLTEYVVDEDNDVYYAENGVLLAKRQLGAELVAFPSKKTDSLNYVVPEGVIRVAEFAFYLNEHINSVVFPQTIKTIGDRAFYGTSIKIYEFTGIEAPELEASYGNFTMSNDSYYWQVYANFFLPFNADLIYQNGQLMLTEQYFLYLTVTANSEDDVWKPQDETFYGGNGGFSGYDYGLTIITPSNARGFNSFVWANYFTIKKVSNAVLEANTIEVIEMLKNLPAAGKVTEADRAAIKTATTGYNSLVLTQQALIDKTLIDNLNACNKALTKADTEADNAAANSVKAIIADLPAIDKLALTDKAKVEDALARYNALTSAQKAAVDSDSVAKLFELKAQIAQLEKQPTTGGKKDNGNANGIIYGIVGLILGAAIMAAVWFFCLRKRVA